MRTIVIVLAGTVVFLSLLVIIQDSVIRQQRIKYPDQIENIEPSILERLMRHIDKNE